MGCTGPQCCGRMGRVLSEMGTTTWRGQIWGVDEVRVRTPCCKRAGLGGSGDSALRPVLSLAASAPAFLAGSQESSEPLSPNRSPLDLLFTILLPVGLSSSSLSPALTLLPAWEIEEECFSCLSFPVCAVGIMLPITGSWGMMMKLDRVTRSPSLVHGIW